MKGRVAVLGAGMVGVCCALSLQRRGYAVTLIDRKAPGRETSYGNSGVFSRSSIFPINGPGLLRALPSYVGNRHPAVRWRVSLLAEPRWLAAFLRQCTRSSMGRRAAALDALVRLSIDLNRRLIAEAGLQNSLRETGWLKVWRNAGTEVAQAEARALAGYGIRTAVVDELGVARIEPAAERVFRAGLHILDSASVDDPGAIVAGYVDLFARDGGRIVTAEARALLPTSPGWRIETSGASHDAEFCVVALGPWSCDLLRPPGFHVPMFFERGYHVHLRIPEGGGPQRAVYDVDGGYVVSPMAGGARVTSGVELAARDAAPNHAQINAAAALARRTFALGEAVEATPWLGSRPTLPDSLPVIGPAPHHHGLYAAFGHQHIGFSTGAATGEIIAAMIDGVPPPIDASPFAPGRFDR